MNSRTIPVTEQIALLNTVGESVVFRSPREYRLRARATRRYTRMGQVLLILLAQKLLYLNQLRQDDALTIQRVITLTALPPTAIHVVCTVLVDNGLVSAPARHMVRIDDVRKALDALRLER